MNFLKGRLMIVRIDNVIHTYTSKKVCKCVIWSHGAYESVAE